MTLIQPPRAAVSLLPRSLARARALDFLESLMYARRRYKPIFSRADLPQRFQRPRERGREIAIASERQIYQNHAVNRFACAS